MISLLIPWHMSDESMSWSTNVIFDQISIQSFGWIKMWNIFRNYSDTGVLYNTTTIICNIFNIFKTWTSFG